MKSKNVMSTFAQNVFDYNKMKKYLPLKTYKAIVNARENNGKLLPKDVEIYADALKKWALKKGVTRYTHWFQPLNNFTAEKRDSLTSLNKEGNAIVKFRGKELTTGEGDASSFPNGGMRQTFEARGVTNWDYTAFSFIKGDCLCIPTTFCGFNGEVLDKKTPLLNSSLALNKQALRILNLLQFKCGRVRSVVGAEQEYFLIKKSLFDKRRDLVYTGRTLFGAEPCKGQESDGHYFRPPTDDVLAFMRDVDDELWKLGIIVKTEHNEVAPCQCELAPCYSDANDACNQNQLIMETLKNTAEKHGLKCLLHEKPFDKINGSGKHNNWSLLTDYDENLLEAGNTPKENARFLLFLASVIKAVDDYNGLLLASIASAGNDLRLGGYEAPPRILTVFLGEPLSETIKYALSGNWRCGTDTLPKTLNVTDRNRTSPFAFTGNKFEFRMVGSAASIADVNTTLNTIVAESLKQFADKLENETDLWQGVKDIITDVFERHKRVLFDGNNYSESWLDEAKRRGLVIADTVQSIRELSDEQNVGLFERHGILTRREQLARQEILFETYCDAIRVESAVTCEIVEKQISPYVEEYQRRLAKLIYDKTQSDIPVAIEKEKLNGLINLHKDLLNATADLKLNLTQAQQIKDTAQKAELFKNGTISAMREVRKYADALERICPQDIWTLPTYGQMLFGEE